MSVPNLFPTVSADQWKAQIVKDLKGRAYESLQWPTPDGITLEPFYTNESLTGLPIQTLQAAQRQLPGWLNAPRFIIGDVKMDKARLRKAVEREANALIIRIESTPTQAQLAQLLDGIKLSDIPVFFELATAEDGLHLLESLVRIAPYQLKGGLLLSNVPTTREAYTALAEATRLTADSPQFRTVSIRSHAFHQAGATPTQELAITLAALAEQYDHLTDLGLDVSQLLAKTAFSIPVGTSYFPEIARLRALRVLVNRFQSAWKPETATPVFILAETSTFYYAAVEPYTNLLRATTEAMAAVIGGCDALTVYPYDLQTTHEGEELALAERIARNIPILLKDESHLDKVADPAAGAYALEYLTHSLVEAAWAMFLDIEKQGGFTAAQSFVQTELATSYAAKAEALKAGKVMVGVNKFSTGDRLSQDVSAAGPRLSADVERSSEAALR